MNLLDRYVQEVTRNLPEKQREDVAKELRGTIEDMAQSRDPKGEISEKAVRETLVELGDPCLLAHKYHESPRYLIGPVLYDAYISTLTKVVTIVPPIFFVVMLVLGFIANEESVMQVIMQNVFASIGIALQIAFWVTLTFVILERAGITENDLRKHAGKWTPDQLPQLAPKRQISASGSIASIVWGILTLAAVAASNHFIGVKHEDTFVQFFHPDLWNFWLPAAMVIGGLSIIQEIWKLRVGNWTKGIAAGELLFGIVGIGYIVLLSQQHVVNPEFVQAIEAKMHGRNFVETIRISYYITLAAVLVAYVTNVATAVKGYFEFRKR